MLQSTSETPKYTPHLREDKMRTRIINFRRFKVKNIKVFQPFPELPLDFYDVNQISKACGRNSDFVKTLTINWDVGINSRQFRLHLKKLRLLSENMKYLSSLQALDLQFPSMNIIVKLTDDGMEQLCQGIKRLDSLEKFRLRVGSSGGLPNITLRTQGLKRLGQTLKRLALLKEIDIEFAMCKEMTNEGLIELSKGIRQCRSLKKLSLKFYNCDKIKKWGLESTSEAIRVLSRDIKKLTSLETLNLNFSVIINDFGADVDLEVLSRSLKKLVQLKEIKLNFAR